VHGIVISRPEVRPKSVAAADDQRGQSIEYMVTPGPRGGNWAVPFVGIGESLQPTVRAGEDTKRRKRPRCPSLWDFEHQHPRCVGELVREMLRGSRYVTEVTVEIVVGTLINRHVHAGERRVEIVLAIRVCASRNWRRTDRQAAACEDRRYTFGRNLGASLKCRTSIE